MKMNLRKTYYLITLSALALVAVVGLLLMPGVNTSGTVSAQDGRAQVATADMINYALMHKADDPSATYGFINQLPCTEIAGESLAGRTVKPGVYCLSSANLAGDIILDGEGDAKSTFIFRVAGSLNAKGVDVSVTNEAMASNVHFVAESATLSEGTNFNGNILTRKAINVEDGSTLKGSTRSISGEVVAAESAVLGAGTGSLQICKNVITPLGGAGTALDLRNRIFNFEVTSARLGTTQTVRVVANSCSTARDIPNGLNTIRELNTGQVFDNSPGGSGQVTGSFNGQFELVTVEDITTPRSTSNFGQTNLQERTQVVNIVEGGTTTELAVRFTNRFAITGFVQICKQAATGSGITATAADLAGLTAAQQAALRANTFQEGANPAGSTPLSGGDPNVTGFFQFTIEGVFAAPTAADPGSNNLRVFTAPVGGCTNAIAVTIGDPVPTTTIPRMSTVNITELGNNFGRTDFFLEDIYTLIADRNNFEVLGRGINADGNEFSNPGGGYINVDVFEASGSANETLVVFVDRSNPGLFKVCKVGGPGIPFNTLFRFRVTGIGPTTADGVPPEGPDFGRVQRFVDVRAGTPLEPTCVFVPGFGGGAGRAEFQTFVNGTRVDVEELGISLDNLVAVPALGPGSTAEVRTSRITTTTSFTTPGVTASFNPNPNFTPVGTGPISDAGTRRVSAASTVGRMGTTIVEFTNVIFNPTVLKVCKIGTGTISTAGDRNFTFDVNFVPPTGVGGVSLFDPQFTGTRTVTAAAGTAADGGFCTIVSPTGLLGGAFNIGSTFTITERSQTGVTVSGISSPSGTPLSGVDLTARTATVGGLVAGVNTVTFTNTNTTGVDGDGLAAVPFDFDGDRKSDLSIYRGGTWWYAASSANGQQRATTFGLATDKTVPADYDGDGKSDNAVYRGGIWHILGSRDGYTGIQFGLAGDIPQAGDFDGDKKADVAVFRPSNGVWYMMGSRDGFMAVQFGANGDVPVAADFDGDGKMDPAVYRNGTWFMLRSKDGFAAPGFGLPTDIPVAADYDGDKKADIAVYRGGTWYQLRSTEGFRSLQLGISTDQPVPADYDGDSKADAAVYRGGIWYMIRSGQSGEAESVQFGVSSDVPVPASFLRR
jgi:hypothetical protein